MIVEESIHIEPKRKLQAGWSFHDMSSLTSTHGSAVEDEMLKDIAAEIREKMDAEIIRGLLGNL